MQEKFEQGLLYHNADQRLPKYILEQQLQQRVSKLIAYYA